MRTLFIILTITLLAAGCSRAGSVPTADRNADSPKITRGLSTGMPYAKLRTRLLLSGWLPLQNPGCAEAAGQPKACNRWLELQDCRADGPCTMAWGEETTGRVMQVEVSGMPDTTDADIQTANVKVAHWELDPVDKTDARAVAPKCPSPDFGKYLPAFAGQPAIRHAFTAPLVQARVLVSDGDGDRTETVVVRGNRPDVFDVGYDGAAFHHIGVDGLDPADLTLKVQINGNDEREVSYVYGSSEGRGFRFTFQKGCWYLTGNPQPTGP